MKTKLLDYYKMILNKVSFDANLFVKEYQKAVRSLHINEVDDLNDWLKSNGLMIMASRSEKNHQTVM